MLLAVNRSGIFMGHVSTVECDGGFKSKVTRVLNLMNQTLIDQPIPECFDKNRLKAEIKAEKVFKLWVKNDLIP